MEIVRNELCPANEQKFENYDIRDFDCKLFFVSFVHYLSLNSIS